MSALESREGPPQGVEEDVRAFVAELVERMALQLHLEVNSGDELVTVRLEGEDRDMLLQERAELLEALQYLVNRAFAKRLGDHRVMVDCGNFRKLKEEELKEIAGRASEKVQRTGEHQELGLMNPYERRIVHLAVAECDGVRSESSGEGFMKRVTILPASD